MDLNNKWRVMKFSSITPIITPYWDISTSRSSSRAYTLSFGENESDLYVGGKITSSSGSVYLSVSRIDSSAGTLSWHIGIINGSHYVRRLAHYVS